MIWILSHQPTVQDPWYTPLWFQPSDCSPTSPGFRWLWGRSRGTWRRLARCCRCSNGSPAPTTWTTSPSSPTPACFPTATRRPSSMLACTTSSAYEPRTFPIRYRRGGKPIRRPSTPMGRSGVPRTAPGAAPTGSRIRSPTTGTRGTGPAAPSRASPSRSTRPRRPWRARSRSNATGSWI